jgi:HlyD family secretion protein
MDTSRHGHEKAEVNTKKLPKSRPGRRGLLLGGLAIGIGLAWTLSSLGGRTPTETLVPTANVQRGPVRVTVTETGALSAASQATVSAPTDKTIVWLAPEGARVQEGDPVVRFEARKYQIATEASESLLAVAQADLRRAESDLAGQRAAEEKARLDYQSLPELEKKGFITKNELEAARLAYEEVRAQTSSLLAQVEAARANVGRAEKDVNEQERRLGEGVVRAPRDGVVVYATHGDSGTPRKIAVGLLPFEGMDLMYLPDPTSMTAELQISEYDLAKVRVGSAVELRLEAYPGVSFSGRVAQVSSLAREKISRSTGKPTGLKVFDVLVEILDTDERLRPGLTAVVEIVVSEHPDALYRLVAYRQAEDGFEVVPLELDGSTDRVAIVSGGLDEGDEVALLRPAEG